jgi:glycosyltransferase involved in cell wall biosynthesis
MKKLILLVGRSWRCGPHHKMNILYVITGADIGGAQKHLLYISKWFNDKRHHIQVITGEDGPLNQELEKLGIAVTVIPIPRKIEISKDLKALFRLASFIKKGQYDVVHSHSSKAGILARISGYYLGIRKNVFTAHGFVFTDPTLSRKKKLFYVWLEKICSRLATDIITVSHFDYHKGNAEGIHPRKMHMIHNGIPNEHIITRYDWQTKQEILNQSSKRVIGFVGRFASEKNIDMLIRIAALINQSKMTNVEIWLLGDGPLFQYYQDKVSAEGLAHMIHFKGNQDNVLDWMDQMHVLAITSHKEGLPYVLLEAISRGLPIISTDVGGIKEILGKVESGKLIVPINDDKQMFARLAELLTNDEQREAIGKELVGLSEKISNDHMCKELEKVYAV